MNSHELINLSEQYISESSFSKATIKSYRIAFKYYIRYLTDYDIEQATTGDVIRYRESRRAMGYSTHYIYIHISALKGLYRYLRLNQKRLNLPTQYAHDIMTPIKNERIKQTVTKPILTIKQAKQMILHTKNNRKYIWHYRDHAILYLMITTGLRSFEVIQAKRKDYQVVNEECILHIRKNRENAETEFVKITKGVKEAIDEYLKKRKDDNPYLFVTTKNTSPKLCLSRTFFKTMFARVLEDCDLVGTDITPHCLRHTAATMNLLRGGSLEQTQKLMRHVDLQSTLVYATHIERMKDDSENQIEKFILGEEPSDYDESDFYIMLG